MMFTRGQHSWVTRTHHHVPRPGWHRLCRFTPVPTSHLTVPEETWRPAAPPSLKSQPWTSKDILAVTTVLEGGVTRSTPQLREDLQQGRGDLGPSPSGPVYSGSSPGLSLQLQESCLQTQVSSRASCVQRLRQQEDRACPDDLAP